MRVLREDRAETIHFLLWLQQERIAAIPKWVFGSCLMMIVAVFTLALPRATELKAAAWNAAALVCVLYHYWDRLQA